jgi:hypothetical protein
VTHTHTDFFGSSPPLYVVDRLCARAARYIFFDIYRGPKSSPLIMHAALRSTYLLTHVHAHVHTCTIRAHTCLCHGTRQLLLRSQPGDNLLCCVRMCHGMTVAPHLNQLAWHQPADGRPDGSACMTHASFTQMSSDVTPPFPFLGDRLPKVPVRRLASQIPFRSEGQ